MNKITDIPLPPLSVTPYMLMAQEQGFVRFKAPRWIPDSFIHQELLNWNYGNFTVADINIKYRYYKTNKRLVVYNNNFSDIAFTINEFEFIFFYQKSYSFSVVYDYIKKVISIFHLLDTDFMPNNEIREAYEILRSKVILKGEFYVNIRSVNFKYIIDDPVFKALI